MCVCVCVFVCVCVCVLIGRLHASVGIPSFMETHKPKTGSVNKNTIQYSYNIFVMLDQLKNIDDPDMMLAPSEYTQLKLLIEDNDEVYVYVCTYMLRPHLVRPCPYITSSPLCLLRVFTSCSKFAS